MTKLRAPLTLEGALLRIAELIGWKAAAAIVGVAERTLRNWSDPDTSAGITLAAALKLDVAFHAAGGEGAPMLQAYQARLGVDCAAATADRGALARNVAEVARRDGKAIEAAIIAAQPGSTDNQLALAETSLEESIAAEQNALSAVHALRKNRVPEVALPAGIGAAAQA